MKSLLNFSPYLPEGAGEKLKAYQYKGEDRSYLYKYFWRPLCVKSVEYLPMWLAPNVITVTGLLGTLTMYFVLFFYLPFMTLPGLEDFDGTPNKANRELLDFHRLHDETPRIVFVLAGVALFMYQYLDNMDGHQARRTKSSSPLGLLMDHGCDAFNCTVGGLSIATTVCAGPTWKTWVALTTGTTIFFLNTWEEYYRGALILPVINGPNEGLMTAVSLYFLTAYVGPTFWLATISLPVSAVPTWALSLLSNNGFFDFGSLMSYTDETTGEPMWGLVYNTVLVIGLVSSAVATSMGHIFQVYKAVHDPSTGTHGRSNDNSWLVKRFPFVHALTRLLPLTTLFVMANIWFYVSPAMIFRHHPRIFCWTTGLLFAKTAIHLMIAHMCNVEFQPLRRTLIPFLYFGLHIGFVYFYFNFFATDTTRSNRRDLKPQGLLESHDEVLILYEFFALSLVTFAHLAVNTVREAASVLDVNVWTIKKKKE